jgi:tetratricopeptide (TPR) repeat protein
MHATGAGAGAGTASGAPAGAAGSGASPPDLPEIFRALTKQKRTGTLKTTDGSGRSKYLYFNSGEIDFIKSRKSKTVIGRALLKRRKVGEQDLARALKRHQATGEKLGKCCIALGLCREEDIREALTFQAIEEVTDLLTWRGVRSEFHRGEPPLDIFDFDDLAVRLRLSTEALVRESERRVRDLEQLRKVVPSFADVYAPSAEAVYTMRPPQEGSPEAEVLRLLDGERDVDEMLEHVRLSDIEALRALDRLVRTGEVAPIAANQLFQVASECEREGNLEKARRLYLRAEECGYDQLDLPNRIGKVADALGLRDEAVRRFVQFAERCAGEELPDVAIAAYKKALETDPGSLVALEKLTALLVRLGRSAEAIAHMKTLAPRYDPERERDKAHRVWSEVLRLDPDDADAHRALAGAYLAGGDKVQAIIELEELAAIHLSRGAPTEAVEVLKEVLAIDPECVEAHLELAATYTHLERPAEAVEEYEKLADSLSRTGVGGGEATNWQFLIDINEKIVSLAPENRRSRQWLAQAYGQKAEIDKAIAHYEGLVQALERSGAPADELAQALRQYSALRPDDFSARERLGAALAASGKADEAVAVLVETREAALKAHRFEVARRVSESTIAVRPFDLDAHRAIARVAQIEKDEGRAAAKWRDVAHLASAAGLVDDALAAAEKALELEKDPETRRALASALERKGRAPEAARMLAEAAREDFAREDFGRARKAAERALALDPESGDAKDVLLTLDGRKQATERAVAAAASAKAPAAPDRPPAKPTITGGNPDVTIVDRPRRKYGSVTNVSEKLRAIRDPSQSGSSRIEEAEASPPAAPAHEEAPRKTLGAAAKLRALKGGGGLFGGFGGGLGGGGGASGGAGGGAPGLEAAAAPAGEPGPGPGAGAGGAEAPAVDDTHPPAAPGGLPVIPPSEPQAVAQPAKKALSAADRLKRLKSGGGEPAAPATPSGATGADGASAAIAERIAKAEAGEVQEGGARKALSAAAKLKALGKRP